jgi:UDP-GlcNAc:undecaprenyl-phosphate GlcNAc-1-phosphate transferase
VVAALIAPAFALALPILDVSFAVLRRGLRGLPVFRADQKHLHHCLIMLGFSREGAVLILYTISFLCLSLAFGVFWLQGRQLPLFCGLLFLVLAIAGHVLGFTRNWIEIAGQLGKSLTLRKETRYALALGRWLEMEAERQDSLDALWQDYQFVVKRLGFASVHLRLPDGGDTRLVHEFDEATTDLQKVCHELDNGSVIQFFASPGTLPEPLFKLLADLAAETWHRAALRWRTLHHTSVNVSEPTLPEFVPQDKFLRFYTPIER